MKVELLVVPDCPHEAVAAELLRSTLEGLGLADVAVTMTVVATQADATRLGFTGSPTILVNGVDPFAEPGRAPALACRVYADAGGLGGVPDARALRQALERAATSWRASSGPPGA